MLTLSNVDVFRCVGSWLVTARPKYAVALIASVSWPPTCVHEEPSADTKPVTF